MLSLGGTPSSDSGLATPVTGVLAVADAQDRMPEKSTYFYPKPPAGLVLRDLDAL